MKSIISTIHEYGYNIIGFCSSSAAVYENRTGHFLLQINWTDRAIEGIEDLQQAVIFGLVGFVIPVLGKRALKKIGWSEDKKDN